MARRALNLSGAVDLHGAWRFGPSLDAYFFKTELPVNQARGCWMLLESCRRYNKPAILLRQLRELDAQLLRRARILETRLPRAIRARLRHAAPPGRKRELRVLGWAASSLGHGARTARCPLPPKQLDGTSLRSCSASASCQQKDDHAGGGSL